MPRTVISISLVPSEHVSEIVGLAKKAEDLGYSRLMLADNLERDTFAIQALCAAVTRKLGIGVSVANPLNRHPAVIAGSASTIEEISGGRSFLGIGVGGNAIRILGRDGYKPAIALRESMSIINPLLKGEVSSFQGAFFTTRGASLAFPERKRKIPLIISSVSPMVEKLAGEMADFAVIGPTHISKENYKKHISQIREGVKTANRSRMPVILPHLYTCCSKNRELARKSVKIFAARALIQNLELGILAPRDFGIGPKQIASIKKGLGALSGLYALNYNIESSLDRLIDDKIVDGFAVSGSPEECSERLEQIKSFGFSQVQIYVVPILGYKERIKGYFQTLESLAHSSLQ